MSNYFHLFECKGAKKPGEMKVGPGGLHRRPGQPVRMRGRIGAFIKIAAPDGAGGRAGRLLVAVQDIQRDAAGDGPDDGPGDLRAHQPRQGVAAFDPAAEGLREFDDGVSFGTRVKMKEDSAAAIDFQVEISPADIRTGGKKELDTAVPADILLVARGRGPDIPVLNPEQHQDGGCIIGHFHLGLREVLRPFPHIMAEPLRRDTLPGRGIPAWRLGRAG